MAPLSYWGKELQDWLALVRAPGLGRARLLELIQQWGGPSEVCSAPEQALAAAGLSMETIRAIRDPDPDLMSRDMEWLGGEGHHLVSMQDEEYPSLLTRTPAPPPVLFVRGQVDVLWAPQLAVVGSRNPTSGGLAHARDFASELAGSGLTITSGLAAGVDLAAHQAALARGGSTIAVMGTGPDLIYPRGHEAVAEAITDKGALVTEFPPGTGARRSHFPARNRLISGLSLGVLVIEGGINSGSLITARLASEQGREVFALPGSLHNPLARGCHRLIKEGARLTESVDDVLTELGPLAGELAGALRAELANSDTTREQEEPREQDLLDDEDYQLLWEQIGFDPEPIDQLVERSGMGPAAVSSMLLMLELKGMVERHPGGRICRSGEGA